MRAQALAPSLEIELYSISSAMKASGLPDEFIVAAIRTASEYEGVWDLVRMWRDETDAEERDLIVADIQDMIDDCAQTEYQQAAYVRFNDLERIAKDIRAFKDSLLLIVNQKGGMKHLSHLSKIPQPSLSRFFNTDSMPRRATLQKIAQALELDAVQIATEWSR